MSDFWAKRLGAIPAETVPAPPQQPAAPPANLPGPWWASQPTQPPQQPSQPVHHTNPSPEGTPQQAPTKARSASLTATCPNCSSDNYFQRGGPNGMTQCYDCGYNPRFEHSTAGAGIPTSDAGPATPAKQIASGGAGGHSNFHSGADGNVIGHI